MKVDSIRPVITLLRPNQWLKNLILFAAIVFTGKLFDLHLLQLTSIGFLIFCAISSSSYIFNDIIDVKYDRLHPDKKNRPLAKGLVKLSTATEIAFVLVFIGLIAALFLSFELFLTAFAFSILHIMYSLILKKYAILDILSISFSFTLRALAGEMLTGYHLPIWLLLCIFFASLFIASTKRHSEYIRQGTSTRPALFQYREHLLDFYTSTFATAAILSYALFTFLEEPLLFTGPLKEFIMEVFPHVVGRKWLIVTIPFIVFGLMRYAQLIYEGKEGEKPEKIITTDKPLIIAILMWAIAVVTLLYVV